MSTTTSRLRVSMFTSALALITSPLAMIGRPMRSVPVRERRSSSSLQTEIMNEAELKRNRRGLRLCREGR